MTFKSSGLSNMPSAGPVKCGPSVVSTLSESAPTRGFLEACRLGPGCPLPGAGALLSNVVQERPVRASPSGLPEGSLSARGRPEGCRHSSAMLCAASAMCRAVCAGGLQSIFTVRAKRGDPEEWFCGLCVSVHRLSLNGVLLYG